MKCQQPLQTVESHRCLCVCHYRMHAIRFNYICASAYNCCCLAFWKDNVRYLKIHKLPLEDGCFVFWCYLPDEYWNNFLTKLYNRGLVAVLVFRFWHSVHNNNKSVSCNIHSFAVIYGFLLWLSGIFGNLYVFPWLYDPFTLEKMIKHFFA